MTQCPSKERVYAKDNHLMNFTILAPFSILPHNPPPTHAISRQCLIPHSPIPEHPDLGPFPLQYNPSTPSHLTPPHRPLSHPTDMLLLIHHPPMSIVLPILLLPLPTTIRAWLYLGTKSIQSRKTSVMTTNPGVGQSLTTSVDVPESIPGALSSSEIGPRSIARENHSPSTLTSTAQ